MQSTQPSANPDFIKKKINNVGHSKSLAGGWVHPSLPLCSSGWWGWPWTVLPNAHPCHHLELPVWQSPWKSLSGSQECSAMGLGWLPAIGLTGVSSGCSWDCGVDDPSAQHSSRALGLMRSLLAAPRWTWSCSQGSGVGQFHSGAALLGPLQPP